MKQKFIIFYIACSFFACKPEERLPNEYNYYYLTAEQLGKTPYFNNPDFDTLTFVSNLQDTLVFAKTTTDSSFYLIESGDAGTGVLTFNYHQQIKINYQTLKGNGSFGVEHVLFDYKYFGEDRIYYYFNSLPFRCWHFNIGQKWLPTYKELFEINGKLYKDVLVLYSPASDSLANKAYINQAFGLFHFVKQGNDTLYTLQTP
ncbi:MAG: hypothetical protein KA981_12535 [Bacteroidia bacterium]|nr:hypothetical protein [Bacteroidia bacterium]